MAEKPGQKATNDDKTTVDQTLDALLDDQDETQPSAKPSQIESAEIPTDEADAIPESPKEPVQPIVQNTPPTPVVVEHGHGFKHWIATHKKIVIPGALLIVLAVLAVVPYTRFALAGQFYTQTQKIVVTDAQTKQPVSDAKVTLAGKIGHTNNKGEVAITAKVGQRALQVTKQNYKTAAQDITMPILKPKHNVSVSLQATGRQVTVMAKNSLTDKPIENATFTVDSARFKTNAKGQVSLVVPAQSTQVEATLNAQGYHQAKATIVVNAQTLQIQIFKLTPTGKVYFLSNKSGKLDVVKSNLDGTDRQTVIAGTGKEDNPSTALLASQDWRYLTLVSKRDGGQYAKLFLIDTQTDRMTTMDEGNAEFSATGWHNHTFIYSVNRVEKKPWESGRTALKSFNAESGKLATLDQNEAVGDKDAWSSQQFSSPYIFDNELVYTVAWNGYTLPTADRTDALRSIADTGKNKKDVKTFAAAQNLNITSYEPNSVYVWTTTYQEDKTNYAFYEYENGAVKTLNDATENTIKKTYPTYLASPANKQTFWSEPRDGKNALFVGDASGKNSSQIASLSEYSAYGWYTDDYLLVAKGGSELYVMAKDGSKTTKVTDYYKPSLDFSGYGRGYGGL